MATEQQPASDRDARFRREEHVPPAPTRPRLGSLAAALGAAESLDGPAEAIAKQVRHILKPGALKDALSGTWLGHPLHPLLTDLPIGAWTWATVLDVVGGRAARPATQRLLGLGVVTAIPTALAGSSDYADTTLGDDRARRIGIVHAVANVTALGLFGASWLARRRGDHGRGVTLGIAGAGAMAAGGQLGGELVYARGVGADVTRFEDRTAEWTSVIAEDDLRDGEPRAVDAGGEQALLVRRGERIFALANRCTHRGGPLADGELHGDCIQCPWHGSRFDLADGSVRRGPATFPQPTYAVRVRDGQVQVRAAG
jgi:nitrite reductase/ring-hydroxylating ferredoxin subunit/uncharacterized membrane protein